jgi:hypothetical protein
MSTNREGTLASVDLYWLPLGVGDAARCVRWNGRIFEALVARHEHREPCDLYHSALEVQLDGDRFVIEMTPVWGKLRARSRCRRRGRCRSVVSGRFAVLPL